MIRLALNIVLSFWDVMTAFDPPHQRNDFGRYR
jgi:hypothetical protein